MEKNVAVVTHLFRLAQMKEMTMDFAKKKKKRKSKKHARTVEGACYELVISRYPLRG